MRSNEIFSRMSPEEAQLFLAELKQEARPVAALALNAAAQAFKLRPEFIRRQPAQRQAEWMRKALGRSVSAALAEELLATYFLEYQRPLLVELLDALEIKHEDGALEAPDPECPTDTKLHSVVSAFRQGEHPARRELLLRAFAAQSGVDWPPLEKLLDSEPPAA